MSQGDWVLSKEKNGIAVFHRTVKGSQFKAFKGVAEVNCSLSAIVALLLDAENMASWLHKTEEVRLLETVAENERVAYMAFDFAPLPKRDLVVRNKITQDTTTKVVNYSMDYLSDHTALIKSRRGRVKDLRGYVRAEPVAENRTKVTYQTHIEPGLSLLALKGVAGVVNKLLSDTPYYTLVNAKAQLAKPQFLNAQISFIEDV